ncbi:MAG TPA: hypothetical protein VHW01_32075 [Polyangiaceae bacterium]|jgi:hypothetical protein|nr:hypothetical protein [Polyangiaceae bacterium]
MGRGALALQQRTSQRAKFTKIWDALEQQNIPFTCHWGQLSGMNASRLSKYFGAARIAAWKQGRAKLLTAPNGDTTAPRVCSPRRSLRMSGWLSGSAPAIQ